MSVDAFKPTVRGIDVDHQTRCAHWHSPREVIAIKMKCCGVYYARKDCHAALALHASAVWPRHEWDQRAVLCGVCGIELSDLVRTSAGAERRIPARSRRREPHGDRTEYYPQDSAGLTSSLRLTRPVSDNRSLQRRSSYK